MKQTVIIHIEAINLVQRITLNKERIATVLIKVMNIINNK